MGASSAGGSGSLAKQYVEFVAKGLQDLQDGLAVIRDNLTLTDDAAKAVGDSITSEFAGMTGTLTATKGRIEALTAALASGGYAQRAGELARMNAELQRIGKQTSIADVKAEIDALAAAFANSSHPAAALDAELHKLTAQRDELRRLADFPDRVAMSMNAMRNAAYSANVQLEAMRLLKSTGELDALGEAAVRTAAEMRSLSFPARVAQGVDEFAAKLDAARVRVAVLRNMAAPNAIPAPAVSPVRLPGMIPPPTATVIPSPIMPSVPALPAPLTPTAAQLPAPITPPMPTLPQQTPPAATLLRSPIPASMPAIAPPAIPTPQPMPSPWLMGAAKIPSPVIGPTPAISPPSVPPAVKLPAPIMPPTPSIAPPVATPPISLPPAPAIPSPPAASMPTIKPVVEIGDGMNKMQAFNAEMEKLAKEEAKLAKQLGVEPQLKLPLSKLDQGIAKVREFTGSVGKMLSEFRNSVAGAAASVNQSIASPVAIGAAVAGFQMLTQATRSWVSAGLSGTGHGNLLSAQFTLLSQQIAGVFVPTINLLTRAIEGLGAWFRSLTGDQQAIIRRFVEAAAVMVVVSQVAGRLGGMVSSMIMSVVTGAIGMVATLVSTVIPAIGTIVSAIVTGSITAGAALDLATGGLAAIGSVIGLVVTAFASLGIAGATAGAGIVIGTESGRSALARLAQSVGPLIAELKALAEAAWNIVGPALEQIGERLTGMFAGIDSGPLRDIGQQLLGLLTDIMPVIQSIAGAIIDVVGWIVKAAVAVAGWINQAIGLKGVLAGVAAIAAAILQPFIAQLWIIAGTLAVIFAPMIAAWTAVGAVIFAVGYVIYKVIQVIWRAISPLIETVWTLGKAFFGVAAAVFGPVISAVWELVKAVGSIFLAFSPIGLVIGAFKILFSVIGSIANWIKDNLIPAVQTFIQKLADGIDSLASRLERLPRAMQRMLGIDGSGLRALANDLRGVARNMTATGGKGSQSGRNPRTDVGAVGGNFEGAMDLFKRLNEASVKTDVQRQIELLERIAIATEKREGQMPREVEPVSPPGVVGRIARGFGGGLGGGLGSLAGLW